MTGFGFQKQRDEPVISRLFSQHRIRCFLIIVEFVFDVVDISLDLSWVVSVVHPSCLRNAHHALSNRENTLTW